MVFYFALPSTSSAGASADPFAARQSSASPGRGRGAASAGVSAGVPTNDEARVSPPDAPLLFMGKDKFENEDLIRYGLPHDVWFHVDKLSSAHVYLRLPRGENDIESIDKLTLEACAQLTKANSIAGCKLSECDIKYTPWSNLRKDSDMDVGTIGFHNTKLVRNIRVKKKNEMVNKMHKTKTWKDIDFAADRERFDAIVREEKREADRVMRNKVKEEQIAREKEREARSYKTLFDGAEMQSTTAIKEEYESAQDYEDDFM